MLSEGAYPPGVYGLMLDDGENEIEPSCLTCRYYEERTCGQICRLIEDKYSVDELDQMSDCEYMAKLGKSHDDYCDNYEFEED